LGLTIPPLKYIIDVDMTFPDFSAEYSLFQNGHKYVAGMDEVGRGCLAGPVVAAIVVVSDETQYIPGVNDSKALSASMREKLNEKIIELVASFGIGEASCEEIDELGISPATRLAMERAYDCLSVRPEVTLVDGKYVNMPFISGFRITRGDARRYVISAASIVAKVYRDSLMHELAKKYQGYGFERNVGYGTIEHRSAVERLGICEIHRRTFSPIKEMVQKS